jgi:hypothetical protein
MKISNWTYNCNNDGFSIIPDRIINKPDSFVKYYSLRDYNIEAVKRRLFYFSHPHILNDPFDSCIQFIDLSRLTCCQFISLSKKNKALIFKGHNLTGSEVEQFVTYYFNKDREQFANEYKTFFWNFIFKDHGLLSLTAKNNDLLMWSYYNNNEGFAVEFKNIHFLDKNIFGPFPMNYQEKFETILPQNIEIEKEKLLYLTNIKSKQWAHEEEWRYILNCPNISIPNYQDDNLEDEKRKVKYHLDCVDSVILGYKFFNTNISAKAEKDDNKFHYLFNCCNNNGVPNQDNLKTDLLDFLIDNNISAKQIKTTDDNSFGLKAIPIKIGCKSKGKEYLIETLN